MKSLFKKLVAFAIVLTPLAMPRDAFAACASSMSYVFTNGSSALDASTTNANNNQLLSCARNVDHSQVGSSGIYASQLIPTNPTQATFGGSQTYVFPSGVTAAGPVSGTNGVLSGTLNVAGAATTGNLTTGGIGATSVNDTGALVVGGNAAVTGSATAASFSGPLTGNVTGNLTGNQTGGSINATTGTYSSNVSVAGTLVVTGAATTGNLTTGGIGATSVNDTGALAVGGNATVSGTINVTGAATTGNLTTGGIGATSLNDTGALAVGGNAAVTGALGVTGNTTVSTITATGTATLVGVVASSQVRSTLPSNALGYDTPMYFDAGSSTGSFHHVLLSGSTISGGAGCSGSPQGGTNCYTVTLPANIAFTGLGSFACMPTNEIDNNGSNYQNIRNNVSPTTYDGRTFWISGGGAGQTVSAVCSGY